ncbi:unnamed protein product, partial [marine sediment metagenome]
TVFHEFYRILKENGQVIFLTPNLYDYVSCISCIVPNRLHKFILHTLLNRESDSVFDTYFKMNSKKDILSISKSTGFDVEHFQYLSQYPHYLMFNTILFRLGIMYDKLISKYGTLGFLRPWVLCVLKKRIQCDMDILIK